MGLKPDPKNKQNTNKWYSPEFQQNNSANHAPAPSAKTESRPTFSLSGILGLNQSVELHASKEQPKAEKEKVFFVNHLEQESKILLDTHQKELQKEIQALRDEIKKLINAAGNLDKEVEIAAMQPVVEPSNYQLKFLDRLRVLIASFSRNVSEGTAWMQTLTKRKSRKNAFWGNVKNKKSGGEQYLFSNEHSAARSTN